MLHAIHHNKIKSEVRNNFKASEDSLTSSVFGTLLYLPVEFFWRILQDSCTDKTFPANSGKLISYDFWPHWDSKDTNNSKFIEPDVFFSFNNFDVIVEAKRWDNNSQKIEQWVDQKTAYKNEYNDSEKTLFILAVGGNKVTITHEIDSIKVYKINWITLLSTIKKHYLSLNKNIDLTSSIDANINILYSLIRYFEIHGFFSGNWFNTFNIDPIMKIEYNKNMTFPFQNKI